RLDRPRSRRSAPSCSFCVLVVSGLGTNAQDHGALRMAARRRERMTKKRQARPTSWAIYRAAAKANRLGTVEAADADAAIKAAAEEYKVPDPRKLIAATHMTQRHLTAQIAREIYIAMERLGAAPELLSIVSSYRDTLNDEEILALLKEYNATGQV